MNLCLLEANRIVKKKSQLCMGMAWMACEDSSRGGRPELVCIVHLPPDSHRKSEKAKKQKEAKKALP